MKHETRVRVKIPMVPYIVKFNHIPTLLIPEANTFNNDSDERMSIVVKMINDNKCIPKIFRLLNVPSNVG